MGSLEYNYERDVSLSRYSLDFTRHHLTLQLKPVWEGEGYFVVNDGSTSFGTDFVRSRNVHTEHVYPTNDSVEIHANVYGSRFFANTDTLFENLSEHEMVTKKQINQYILNYLTSNVEFNNTTIVELIEEALIHITLPDVQTEQITQVLDQYRINNLSTDVTNIVYTLTMNQDHSPIITSNVLDNILVDYVQNVYISNLNTLNQESSKLFDYPRDPFYLRLEDYVSTYVKHNVPQLINTGNIVYINYLKDNYYTKSEIDEGGFGSGSGNVDIGNVNLNHLLTKTEANNTYVKKSDFLTDDGNIHFDYVVDSVVNVYKYVVNDIKAFVDCVQPEASEYIYTVYGDIHRIHVTGLETSDNGPVIDHNILYVNDRVLILFPMTNNSTNLKDSKYNGIFEVMDIIDTTTVILARVYDFKTISSIANALIYVKSRSSMSVSNGNSYLVTYPTSTETTFVLNTDKIQIIPFIVQDNTHGSMAYQDHTNVNITGGSIAVTEVYTSTINSIDSNFTVHIPADKYFQITSMVPGETQKDPIFSVDEQGHVSAFQFAQMSDRQLKTNIRPIESAYDIISSLEGKTFDWKDESKNKRGSSYGFIAQEVQNVLPSLVSQSFSGNLAVDYNKVIPILTEAIKELYAMVSQNRTTVAPTEQMTFVEPETPSISGRDDIEPQSRETCSRVVNVIPRPVESNIVTNVYSIGQTTTYIVNMASTDLDDVTMEPIFISVENRQIYSLFTNSGKNTLDGVDIEIHDVVLIKNSKNPKYNGVFKISGIQHVSFGRFSKCYRMDDFRRYEEMQHTTVVVSPSGFAGNGKGLQNVGISFTCILDANNSIAFQLDNTSLSFVSFGLNPQLGTMSMQDHHNVNITGGKITTTVFTTSNLFPYDNATTISLNLKGSTVNDTFQVKNETLDTIFSVDGTGKASAFEYYAPSDTRLKKNVQHITNAIDLVHKLQGVTFDWKKKSFDTGLNYGFIAQDVAKHFPSLVNQRADGFLAVDYSKVVSILVEAVKDIGNMLKNTL